MTLGVTWPTSTRRGELIAAECYDDRARNQGRARRRALVISKTGLRSRFVQSEYLRAPDEY